MLIKKTAAIKPSEITPESLFRNRRQFLRSTAVAGAGLLAAGGCAAGDEPPALRKLNVVRGSPYSTDQAPNSFEDITSYNNFYEFGLDKGDPARLSGTSSRSPGR